MVYRVTCSVAHRLEKLFNLSLVPVIVSHCFGSYAYEAALRDFQSQSLLQRKDVPKPFVVGRACRCLSFDEFPIQRAGCSPKYESSSWSNDE